VPAFSILPSLLYQRTTTLDREVTRKKYLVSLENRTPEQIAEEEALYIEIKRLEQNERRFKRERDDLLRTLVGIDSGLSDIHVDEEGLMALSLDVKKKKKGGNQMDLDSPSTPSNIISLGPPIPKRIQSAKSIAFGILSVLCNLIFTTEIYLLTKTVSIL
jgi:DNA methyltransferase 1-associated protein 1